MISGINVLNSGERVFRILEKLLGKDCHKKELAKDFSENSLFIYINTLKKVGVDITIPNRKNTCYSIKSCLNFINFNDEDMQLFSQMKDFLAKEASYQEIMTFNNLLLKFSKYTNKNFVEKLNEIVKQKPFGIEMHKTILGLEGCIKEQKPVLLIYNSPNSKTNYFKVMPKYLKLENQKMYLWCYDRAFYETRYLRLDRLIDFKILNEPYENVAESKYAVCKFTNVNEVLIEPDSNYEILEKHDDFMLIKFYFENSFDFMQKILRYSTDCKVLEPVELKEKFMQKIDLIRKIYE